MTMFPVLTEPRRRRSCASPTERSAHGSSRTTPASSPEGWPARAASQSGPSDGLRRASASSPGCWQACRSSRSTRRRASVSSSTSSATAIRRSCSRARGAASPATRWSLAAHRRPRHPRRRCCGPPGRAGPRDAGADRLHVRYHRPAERRGSAAACDLIEPGRPRRRVGVDRRGCRGQRLAPLPRPRTRPGHPRPAAARRVRPLSLTVRPRRDRSRAG
jgi:hypothetical protein